MFRWIPLAFSALLVGCNANEGSVLTDMVCQGQEQLVQGESDQRVESDKLSATLERSFKDKPKFLTIETALAGSLKGKYCGDSARGDYVFHPGDCTNFREILAFHPQDMTLVIFLPPHSGKTSDYQASFNCRPKASQK